MHTRREFVKSTGLLTFMAAPSLAWSAAAQKKSDPLLDYDATGLAELVRKKEVSPTELVEATIRRIEALDGDISAVVERSFEKALSAAENIDHRKPFAGVPMLIKDNKDVAGLKTTQGSRFLKDYVAAENSPMVQAYLDLGFLILGKTNMPEFGLLPSTESRLFGACHNPWNLAYSPGGSSGGSAAAVAAGYLPLCHATDGGGSIRIPASACGVFGMKPTSYRMIGEYALAPATRFLSENCVSRTVRDSAQLFHRTQYAGSDAPYAPTALVSGPSPKRLKIGFSTVDYFGNEPSTDVKASIEATAHLLAGLGHTVMPAPNPINGEEFTRHYQTLFAARIVMLRKEVERVSGKPAKETGLLEGFALGFTDDVANIGPDEVEASENALKAFGIQFNQLLASMDVLLTPVLAKPATRLGEISPDVEYRVLKDRVYKFISYTPLQNALGMPAMSVPLGMSSEGLPIGNHFIAPAGREDVLLSLAYELEQVKPWASTWAPKSAKARGI